MALQAVGELSLAASAEASAGAPTSVGLPALEAVLAIHWTVSAWLKRYCGLLSATGTNYTRTLR